MRNKTAVAGIDEHHAVDDDGAAVVHAAAARGDPVDGGEVTIGVVGPDDGAVGARIRSYAAVETRAEDRSGDRRGGAALARAARLAGDFQTQLRLWRLLPDGLAVGDIDGVHSAGGRGQQVGLAEIETRAVDGDAPLAAQAAALAEPVLPDDRALLIRVEGVHHARFLRGNEQVAACGANEGGRAREVIVGSEVAWAGGVVRALGRTTHGPVVGGCNLLHPADRAGLQVHGNDGVSARLRRIGVAVTGTDIQHTATHIDRG